MRLSDVMSAMHLTSYPEVAMVIFLTVFLTVTFDLLRKKDIENARFIPLEERADFTPASTSNTKR